MISRKNTPSDAYRRHRREVYLQIARCVRSGMPLEDIRARFAVCRSTVYNACRTHGVPPKQQRENYGLRAAQRRRLIAEAVRNESISIAEASRRFDVSPSLVRYAIREFGVPYDGWSTYRRLAARRDTSVSCSV